MLILCSASADDLSEFTYRTLDLNPMDASEECLVSMKEAQLFNEVRRQSQACSYLLQVGLTTWFASYLLAELILMRPELFRGKAVLELGSGAGFCGLCLLRKARPRVLQLTDYAPDVLQNLTHNLTISMRLHPHTFH